MSPRFRLLGLLPLLFFALRLADQWREGVPADALWICNISNLFLAMGLFMASGHLIRASFLWLLVGLPNWLWYLWQAGHYAWSSWFIHLGALLVGVIVVAEIRADRRAWIGALVGFVVLQQLCRIFTPAALNVNLAHGLKVGEVETVWVRVVSSYGQFWIVSTLLLSVCLWLANAMMVRLFSPLSQAPFGLGQPRKEPAKYGE